jgi:hypothetical protein
MIQVFGNVCLPSNFVEGMDKNTLLLAIPCDKYGALLGLHSSFNFIPEKFVKRIRGCFIDVLEAIIQFPNNISFWNKFFFVANCFVKQIK